MNMRVFYGPLDQTATHRNVILRRVDKVLSSGCTLSFCDSRCRVSQNSQTPRPNSKAFRIGSSFSILRVSLACLHFSVASVCYFPFYIPVEVYLALSKALRIALEESSQDAIVPTLDRIASRNGNA